MSKIFDWQLVFTQIPAVLKYLPVTLELTAIAMIIGWIVGLLIAIVKIHNVPILKQISTAFVSVIRGTPIIVQLYLTYFGIPIALKYINYYYGTSYNVNGIPPIIFAIVALGLNQSAFDSETIRAAILSVEKGQVEAAKSLGMNGIQIFKRVIVPQAVTVAIPSLGNSLIALVKGTSLAFTCSVVEITAQGKILAGNSYRYFEVYCSLAIIYFVLTVVIERAFTYIEKKMSVPEDVKEEKKGRLPKKEGLSSELS